MDIKAGMSIKHLSRVRKTQFEDDGLIIREILLCAKESIDHQHLASLLWSYTNPALRPRTAMASKWPAHTRYQYESFSKLWPVKAHPEKKRYYNISPFSLLLFLSLFFYHLEYFQGVFPLKFQK